MKIYTLNVGQGNFNVIVGDNEAFVIDTYVPVTSEQNIINVKGALAKILEKKALIGLLITGFDADHFNEVGLRIVLNKYLPNWIMYPKYFKQTDNANVCFKIIDEHDKNKNIARHSVLLQENTKRFYNDISKDFSFEIFSPHASDMSSSNNCSIVCKVTEKSSHQTYLITGDTEVDRWENIIKSFGASLNCKVMAAPHHGSKNGVSEQLMKHASPYKVIVSAGLKNKFGHPHAEAATLFSAHAKKWHKTNVEPDGVSLETILASGQDPITYKFEV